MSSLSQISRELKENIHKDYVSGMEISLIADKYGFKHARTVYFHLAPLSKTDKLAHMKNKIQRMEDEHADVYFS